MGTHTPVLLNTDGLFNSVRMQLLLTCDHLQKLRDTFVALTAEDAAAPKVKPAVAKLRQQQQEVLDLLNQLPSAQLGSCGYIQVSDKVAVPDKPGYRFVYVPALAGNFRTALSPDLIIEQNWSSDPGQWGLSIVKELFARQKALKALAEEAYDHTPEADRELGGFIRSQRRDFDLVPQSPPYKFRAYNRHATGQWRERYARDVDLTPPPLVDMAALKSANRLAEDFDSGKIFVRVEDPVENLSSAHAFAIYGGSGSTAGYLDGRADFVDTVGGARLFASQKSAETTIRSRTLTGAVVVAVDVQVTGLAPGHSAAAFERLGAVVADINRRKLMDLIARARGDDLAELEEQVAARRAELEAAGVVIRTSDEAAAARQAQEEKERSAPRRAM